MKPKKQKPMTAKQVISALSHRHMHDIFLTEVSCGRSGSHVNISGAQRMDAVAIPRRWDRVLVTAYEVKVTRQDFVADDKWKGYLPWCNRFYFVTPKGLLKPEERDELQDNGIGLIEIRPVGSYFRARKAFRSEHRPFTGGLIPWQLYHTIILNKARFGSRMQGQEV